MAADPVWLAQRRIEHGLPAAEGPLLPENLAKVSCGGNVEDWACLNRNTLALLR
jgi:hypothetical protein